MCTCVHFCVALWTFLHVELMPVLFVLNDSKTPKFGHLDPANLYNILEYEQGQVKIDNLTTQRSFN